MGQRVAAETVIDAAPEQVYAVIADLDAYPQWAEDVVATDVLERTEDGLPRVVAFEVDARIALVHYTLEYQHDPPHRVRWRLVEGEMLEAELAIPLPSFIQRRAARVILNTGLAGLRARVEGA